MTRCPQDSPASPSGLFSPFFTSRLSFFACLCLRACGRNWQNMGQNWVRNDFDRQIPLKIVLWYHFAAFRGMSRHFLTSHLSECDFSSSGRFQYLHSTPAIAAGIPCTASTMKESLLGGMRLPSQQLRRESCRTSINSRSSAFSCIVDWFFPASRSLGLRPLLCSASVRWTFRSNWLGSGFAAVLS